MTSYLIFPDLASAQARSHQQAVEKGCDPAQETQYWWGAVENPITKQGAIQIVDSGGYGRDGLTVSEIAALVPTAKMDPSWFPVSNKVL